MREICSVYISYYVMINDSLIELKGNVVIFRVSVRLEVM
jgi:hypothetical protein